MRRPTGGSSRLHRASGPRHPWRAGNGQVVDLPVVLDVVMIDPDSGVMDWQVQARVDLVEGWPRLVAVTIERARGLDVDRLQRTFRWATPVEVVTVLVPQLLASGQDPFATWYPMAGFPAAAQASPGQRTTLTDDFLEAVAREYLAIGRGYAAQMALQRNVSARTVVSWIEKARQRGILSPTRSGAAGGRIVPAGQRVPRANPTVDRG